MAMVEKGTEKALFRSALSTSKKTALPTSEQPRRKSASEEVWSPVRSTGRRQNRAPLETTKPFDTREMICLPGAHARGESQEVGRRAGPLCGAADACGGACRTASPCWRHCARSPGRYTVFLPLALCPEPAKERVSILTGCRKARGRRQCFRYAAKQVRKRQLQFRRAQVCLIKCSLAVPGK